MRRCHSTKTGTIKANALPGGGRRCTAGLEHSSPEEIHLLAQICGASRDDHRNDSRLAEPGIKPLRLHAEMLMTSIIEVAMTIR